MVQYCNSGCAQAGHASFVTALARLLCTFCACSETPSMCSLPSVLTTSDWNWRACTSRPQRPQLTVVLVCVGSSSSDPHDSQNSARGEPASA
eukprot:scaffold214876_cov35-Tisochrysis_lutea.AAC.1